MGLIIIGIIIFLLGFLTPIGNYITLPISIIVIVYGINRILKRKR